MMKRLSVLMLILAFALSGAACFAEEQPSGRPGGLTGERGERPAGDFPGGERGGNRGGGSVDKSGDEALQAMIAEVMPKFQLLTYTDEQTGTQLAYQLYTPEGYDASQRYPLIMFIPDSSAVGRGTDVVLGDEARLFSTRVAVGEVNYLPYDRPTQPVRVQAKLRYTTKFADALLIPTENGCELRFDTPQRAATPGQTAAFYDGEYLIGGGTILGTIEE